MSTTAKDYKRIADKHGIDLANVTPLSKDDRLEKLKQTLVRTDVPFPISPEKQISYLAAASSGKPFGIGPFGNEMVDLVPSGSAARRENWPIYDPFGEDESVYLEVAKQIETRVRALLAEELDEELLIR